MPGPSLSNEDNAQTSTAAADPASNAFDVPPATISPMPRPENTIKGKPKRVKILSSVLTSSQKKIGFHLELLLNLPKEHLLRFRLQNQVKVILA